jgi:long-chain acyl-CoA synthetase
MHYKEFDQVWSALTAPGAPFEVEEIAVRGQKLRSYKNVPPNIRALWLSTAQFAERDYIVFGDERITYGEAHRQTGAIASWLFAQGVKPGDRVAIAMRNYPEWMLIYWACVSVGVAVVGMNAWWVAEEMEYGLKDAQPKVIFLDHERLARMRERPGMEAEAKVVGVRIPGSPEGVIPWAEVIGGGGAMPDVAVDPDADACIFYTSGTTGFPKGAQLTHRGCVSNLFSMMFVGQAQLLATQKATGVIPDPDAPVLVPVSLLTTPLFHVTANNCGAYATTAAGGKIVLMHRWDAGEALKLIERERVTSTGGVPVMAREIIMHPDFDKYDTSSLLAISGGGAPVQPDLVGKIDKALKMGRPGTGYGMTETCGIICSIGADFYVAKPESVGRPTPDFEAKCVDDDGNTVPDGELGELWVRGAQVIKGYLNRPEATAESITDGWLHTGDVARIDEDGFLYIVDRKKDMLLRGGENVYCAEVEACVHRHPAIAECCVFGVPDQRLGEEVGAAVVLRPGHSVSGDELRAHCEGLMARHKAPRYVWFLDEAIPRNASGKFLKRQLRETLKLEAAG